MKWRNFWFFEILRKLWGMLVSYIDRARLILLSRPNLDRRKIFPHEIFIFKHVIPGGGDKNFCPPPGISDKFLKKWDFSTLKIFLGS
jgi:hypothetical protein